MKRMIRAGVAAGVVFAGCLAAAPAAQAEGNFALGISGGTLGIGPELSYRFNRALGVRLSGGFYDYTHSDELDDVDYDAKLKLSNFGGTLDVYPFGGGFRLSVGARSNSNEIDLVGAPTTDTEIGDDTYTPAQIGTLSGTIKTKKMAPVASIGYGGKLAKGFTVGFELGVYAQGSPRIENLASTGGTLSTNPAFQAELDREEADIEDDADEYKLWPILSLHLLYRF